VFTGRIVTAIVRGPANMTTEPSSKSSSSLEWRIVPATIVIAIGVLFLLNNLGYPLWFFFHGNWWALFILLAAIPPFTRAYETYRAQGKLDAEGIHSVLAGSAVVLVAGMFLAGLDWTTWWPVFLILGGLFMLVRRPRRRCGNERDWQAATDDATLKH
jgi:hypothetical protein